MKEMLISLDYEVIYPISNSEEVTIIQVIPKKMGIIVIKTDKNELISPRVQSRWRICIDYRKLNAATQKYHFLLLFLSKMIERL